MMYQDKTLSYENVKRYNDRRAFEDAVLHFFHKIKMQGNIIITEDGDFYYSGHFRNGQRFDKKSPNYIGSIHDDKITLGNSRFIYDYNYMSNYDWAVKFKNHISKWIDDIRIKPSSNTDSVYVIFRLPQNEKQYSVRFSDHIDKRNIANFNFATPLGTNINGKNWDDLVDWFDFMRNNNIVTLYQPYLYHATYSPLIESIKKNGIDSNLSEYNWIDSERGKNYLSRSPMMAYNYAKVSSNVPEYYLKDIVVMTISWNKLDKSKIFSPTNTICFDDDSTVEYREVIPFDAILKIEQY